LDEAEDVPFKMEAGDDPGVMFTHRKNVDAGTDVIDLQAMRAELEAARGKGRP
jgi:hypothetical protein